MVVVVVWAVTGAVAPATSCERSRTTAGMAGVVVVAVAAAFAAANFYVDVTQPYIRREGGE